MATQFSIGFSSAQNGEQAVYQAVLKAQETLDPRPPDLTIVFFTDHYDPHEILPIIIKVLSTTNVIGCSTAAIINAAAIETQGISVLCAQSDNIQFVLTSSEPINVLNAHQEGINVAKACLQQFKQTKRQVSLTFIDGLLQEKAEFTRGLQTGFGNIFPIVGAGSCDNLKFQKSHQILGENIMTRSAVNLLLGGDITVGIGSRHGWRPLGKPRTIDEAETNIIKTISGKPAIQFYQHFFDSAPNAPTEKSLLNTEILYPLGLKIEGNKEYLIRNILKTYQDGSMLCQGDVPIGSEVHLMIGNKETCIEATRQAALEAQRDLFGKIPHFILVIESIARLKLFGRTLYEDIAEIKKVFGRETPIWGMCSHGEISPFLLNDRYKQSLLQNASVVILAIG